MNFPPVMTEGSSRAFKFASSMPDLGWQPVVIALNNVVEQGVEQFPFDVHYVGHEVARENLDAEQLFRFVHGLPQKKVLSKNIRTNIRLNTGVKGSNWKKKAEAVASQVLHDNPDVEMIYAQAPPFAPQQLAIELSGKHHLPVIFDCIGDFDDDKMEAMILFSGHCVVMPSREKKEFFLRKYRGRLSHDEVSIVKNGYDPAFLPTQSQQGEEGLLMRWVFQLEKLRERELKEFFSGLSNFVAAQPAIRGAVTLAFTGNGSEGVGRYLKKNGLEELVDTDAVCSHRQELDLCMQADLYCMVLGTEEGHEMHIPERIYDVEGMRTSLAGIVPDGLARQILLEAGGMVAPISSGNEISEFLQESYNLWRSGQLPVTSEEKADGYHIRSSLQEFLREMAFRLPPV